MLVTVSDPWDLGEALKWQPLPGELVRIVRDGDGGRALIKFDRPIQYRGSICHYAVAAPRHEDGDIAMIEEGTKVDCALTCISDEQAQSSNPVDTSDWRGGSILNRV